jgi:hypothetical protein
MAFLSSAVPPHREKIVGGYIPSDYFIAVEIFGSDGSEKEINIKEFL